MFHNWNNVTLDERNDLVFDGRNQNYGAYELRQNYNRRITFIIGGVLAFSFALFGLKLIIDNKPKEVEKPVDMSNIVVDLTPPPPQEEQPPPPPPPPPPPMAEMVKFVPPVVDDKAVEEEPQKLQEDVKDSNVGEKDQEGDKDLPVVPTENAGNGPVEVAAPEIFTVVEEMPEFPGGPVEMMKYIQKNIQYPQMAKEAGLSGKCFLKFVVGGDGNISDVQILKGVPGCGDCDKEAIRVVKSMPKWKAGKQNGRAVNVYFNLPINFQLK